MNAPAGAVAEKKGSSPNGASAKPAQPTEAPPSAASPPVPDRAQTPVGPGSLPPFALAGCGTVGGALLGFVREGVRGDEGVSSVLVRDPNKRRPVALPQGRVVTRADELHVEPGGTLVELLGGIEPAFALARRTLEGGGRFVTANKALVALHGVELAALADRHGGRIGFEAAVGGGMPVVRLLQDLPPEAGVLRVEGILNGTTNFLLGRLAAGDGWDTALDEARALGYAEADPSRDLDGSDAEDKIRILGWLAFGVPPEEVSVTRRGIVPGPQRIALDAAAAGGVPKLLARVERTGDRVVARVEPCVALGGSPWADVGGVGNRAEVETRHCGTLSVSGPGAGGSATATAVLADLRDPRPGRLSNQNTNFDSVSSQPELSSDAWHLSVGAAPASIPRRDPPRQLTRVLERAGIEGARPRAYDGRWFVGVSAAPSARMDLVRERLEALGLDPVLLRVLRAGG
jgi:homoserine dehydrogenase